jgi:acetyl esterase
MRPEDYTIFEYRMGKEAKYAEIVREERVHGNYQRISYRTKDCGFVDGYAYRPEGSEGETLPVVFDFHGGGFVLGYCEQDAFACRRLAERVHAVVVNVDYPLAPEYPYPLPIEATYEYLQAVLADADVWGIDANNVQLIGHSAGGYLTCALCVYDHERGSVLGLRGAVADCPVVKQYLDSTMRVAKDQTKAISLDRMTQYTNWMFHDLSRIDEPVASPLEADPACFPRLLVVGAEYDALSTDEERLVRKVAEAGGDATFRLFEGRRHGFTHPCFEDEYDEKAADEAWELMGSFLAENAAP